MQKSTATGRPAVDRWPLLTRYRHAIVIVLLLATTAIVAAWYVNLRIDDAYITYRYPLNLVNGQGFTFNPGERILATTSPLHALLLIPFAFLFRDSLPVVAVLVSCLALFILSVHIYLLLARFGYPVAGVLAAMLVPLNIWTVNFLSLETTIVACLELSALYHYLRGRPMWLVAVLAALAVLARMDAILLVGVLFGHDISTRRDIRPLATPAAIFGAILCAWFSFSKLYFGSFLPNTFYAKTAYSSPWTFLASMWPKVVREAVAGQPALTVLAIGLAVVGLAYLLRKRQPLVLLYVWLGLYILGYTVLRISYPFAWYYFPVVMILVVTGCLGGEAVVRGLITARPRLRMVWAAIGLLVALAVLGLQWRTTDLHRASIQENVYHAPREEAYRQAAIWLKDHTPANATVAMVEIGIVGYYSERTVVDLGGLLTPAAIPYLRAGDWPAAIPALKPDYVLLQGRAVNPFDTRAGTLTIAGRVFSDYVHVASFDTSQYQIGFYKRTAGR